MQKRNKADRLAGVSPCERNVPLGVVPRHALSARGASIGGESLARDGDKSNKGSCQPRKLEIEHKVASLPLMAKPLSVCDGSAVFDLTDIAAKRERWDAEVESYKKCVAELRFKLHSQYDRAEKLDYERVAALNRCVELQARIAELEKELAKAAPSSKWTWEKGMQITENELRKDV